MAKKIKTKNQWSPRQSGDRGVRPSRKPKRKIRRLYDGDYLVDGQSFEKAIIENIESDWVHCGLIR